LKVDRPWLPPSGFLAYLDSFADPAIKALNPRLQPWVSDRIWFEGQKLAKASPGLLNEVRHRISVKCAAIDKHFIVSN
jgi:hypothetical protein